jgi:hypothetical protein
VNNEQKWSGCESVLAHFEALMAENIAEVHSKRLTVCIMIPLQLSTGP